MTGVHVDSEHPRAPRERGQRRDAVRRADVDHLGVEPARGLGERQRHGVQRRRHEAPLVQRRRHAAERRRRPLCHHDHLIRFPAPTVHTSVADTPVSCDNRLTAQGNRE